MFLPGVIRYCAWLIRGLWQGSGWAVTPVCNGNLDCVYDVPALPKGGDKLPIYPYGGTTPGYWTVMLAWVPRS